LVVEDELVIANEYVRLLNELGHTPVGNAPCAAEAVILAEKHRPDLVLMDVRLRGAMDGLSAAIEIQTKSDDAQIVFVTAYDDRAMRKRISAFNRTQPIIKPIGLPELAAVLAKARTAVA
jgi:CheY-like chemotaxis protein